MDLDNFIQTIRYVTCIGVKIPSQGDSEPAMTFLFRKGQEESDKGDESEPGLPPGGGEDRYRE